MRLVIVTTGSRGDVQPFVALGQGFQRAGHRVFLATHAPFESFVRAHGLDFSPIAGDPRELLSTPEGKAFLEARDPFTFLTRFTGLVRDLEPRMHANVIRAVSGAEAVIFSTLSFFAYHVALSQGIPAIAAHLQPTAPTGSFPHPIFPQRPRLGPFLNRLTYKLTESLALGVFGGGTRRLRRQLGLPARLDGSAMRSRGPALYGFSPQVVPRPTDWDDSQQVTGYWFLDQVATWEPPTELEAFLAAGPPPVCIGFGSMGSRDPAEATATVLEALTLSGQRGVLIGGWGGFADRDWPPGVLALEEADHAWLFPRSAAVVCHGGAGTTAAALRAGVPCVVIPHGMDQPFWAHRVHELGVGPAGLPRGRLTAHGLARTLTAVAEDAAMHDRARVLGERIRAERGVEAAITFIERRLPVLRP
jgi:UDP:flavonoid glycosyltransferase YjiC (YdhE family)